MESKSYKEMTPEEKEKFLGKAKQVGVAEIITGAATAGAGLAFGGKKLQENGAKKFKFDIAKSAKIAKIGGGLISAAGLGTYGVAKYKHHKLKKQKKEDDNSKK
jgi:hypothetical protein